MQHQRRVPVGEIADLAVLSEHASACELCRLCRDRTVVVTGSGPDDADVLVVAEAPGYHEDRTGRLLASDAGALFDDVLAEAGLRRDDVYVTSVVKCRPTTGRTPFPDEVEACEGWLFREIALVQPKVVVTLGSLALSLVTGRRERISDAHGSMVHAHLQGRDVVVWPLYQPAAALHVASLADELREDARSLGRLLRGARATPRPAVTASTTSGAEPASPPHAAEPSLPDASSPAVTTPTDRDEPQLAFDV